MPVTTHASNTDSPWPTSCHGNTYDCVQRKEVLWSNSETTHTELLLLAGGCGMNLQTALFIYSKIYLLSIFLIPVILLHYKRSQS